MAAKTDNNLRALEGELVKTEEHTFHADLHIQDVESALRMGAIQIRCERNHSMALANELHWPLHL